MKKKFFIASLIASVLLMASCSYQPNPITGTWADNRGDQLTLFSDNTYSAKITNSVGEKTTLNGMYNVMLNAIAFTADNGYQVVSEWDIRGSMLYLEWPDSEGKKLQLTLYKTKN